jgi:hypothetical protein
VADEQRERELAWFAEHDVACPACGYNLRGLRSDRCPECGGPVPDPPAPSQPDPPDPAIAAFLADRDLKCLTCGYTLRGLTTGRCPECGTRYLLVNGRLRRHGERWKAPEQWVAEGLVALTWIGFPLAAVQIMRLAAAPFTAGMAARSIAAATLAALPLAVVLIFRRRLTAWLGPHPVAARARGAVVLVAAAAVVGTALAITAL